MCRYSFNSFLVSAATPPRRFLHALGEGSLMTTMDFIGTYKSHCHHLENPQLGRQHLASATAAALTWYGMSSNLEETRLRSLSVAVLQLFPHINEEKEEDAVPTYSPSGLSSHPVLDSSWMQRPDGVTGLVCETPQIHSKDDWNKDACSRTLRQTGGRI